MFPRIGVVLLILYRHTLAAVSFFLCTERPPLSTAAAAVALIDARLYLPTPHPPSPGIIGMECEGVYALKADGHARQQPQAPLPPGMVGT